MRILVVEDDPGIAAWLRRVFEQDGHVVDAADDGERALAMARESAYDLALLDVGLPGRDGVAVVATLRAAGNRVPVLMLTAREGDDAVARALDAGADDYLLKPISPTVLMARVRAVLRRSADAAAAAPSAAAPATASSVLALGALELDLSTRRVRGARTDAELTAREFALLSYLLGRPRQVVPRERLLQEVWGMHFDPQTNVVEVALSRLRTKLADVASGVRLRTLRGMGVVLEPDEPRAPRAHGEAHGELHGDAP